MFKKNLCVIVFSLFVTLSITAQDDLLSLIEEPKDSKPKKVYATFKSLRIGNAQTIETVKKKHLDYRISHRFGNIYNSDDENPINETFQTFLGFDGVSDIRNSFDYGITDNLQVGIGRSRKNYLVDGSLKWRFMQQTTDFSVPVSVAFFGAAGYSHKKTKDLYAGVIKDFETNEAHRFNYFTQLIIASKVTPWLSVEILPSYMYRNFIKEQLNTNNDAFDVNGFFSLGVGGRLKLNKRLSFIGDYFYNFSPYYQNNSTVYMPLSLGFEIETGGHVFSLFFTNASGLIENNYIPETTETWRKGQIKFGFCISRTFAL
jgi:hypothetical protein